MSRATAPVKDKFAAHRERRRAAGRSFIHLDLPNELIGEIDKLKAERGASARAIIIEEALRFYIEKQQGA